MDNVTHTLIGVTIGHTLLTLKSFKQHPRLSPILVVLTSIIGSNLPDMDFMAGVFSNDRKIAYLLHHRGWTHTFVFTPLIGMVSAALALFFCSFKERFSKVPSSPSPFPRLVFVGVVSAIFHILADSCNDYGVHPFSPFSNRWFFGDFIFIVEPLFWMAMLPLCFSLSVSRWTRFVWAALGVSMIILAFRLLPLVVAMGVVFFGTLMIIFQRRFNSVVPALVAICLSLLVFGVGSFLARNLIHAEIQRLVPSERILQLATSPAPSDPFCWRQVVITLSDDKNYRIRIGTLSLLPALLPPQMCYLKGAAEHERSMPLLNPITEMSGLSRIRWVGEYRRPFAELSQRVGESCRFKALMRFARAPFWTEAPTGGPSGMFGASWIGGDARYDRDKTSGFAEDLFGRGDPCLPSEPPWDPPIDFLNLVP